jgi:hypothetical protein
MGMTAAGLGTTNDCAGDDHLKFIRSDNAAVFFSAQCYDEANRLYYRANIITVQTLNFIHSLSYAADLHSESRPRSILGRHTPHHNSCFFVSPRKMTRLNSPRATASVYLYTFITITFAASTNNVKIIHYVIGWGYSVDNKSNDITVFSFCSAYPAAHITLSICSLLAVFHLSRALTHAISVRLSIFSCAHCTVLLNYVFAILTEV